MYLILLKIWMLCFEMQRTYHSMKVILEQHNYRYPGILYFAVVNNDVFCTPIAPARQNGETVMDGLAEKCQEMDV